MLANQKLYKLVTLKEYNKTLKHFLNNLTSGYGKLSDKKKWEIIIDKLISFRKDNEQFTAVITAFKNSVLNTSNNSFTLSLSNCVHYFENYCFLIATDNPTYKLSNYQKDKIFEAILDAVNTCETGKNTRFEYVLQLYRSDSEWITDTLSKARYQIISRLANQYCAVNRIASVLDPHVLKIMTEYASEKGYGIKIDKRIVDIHMVQVSQNKITLFFDREAPLAFTFEYEDLVIQMLTHHVISKIQECFCPKGSNLSNTNTPLSPVMMYEFKRLIEDLIGDYPITPLVDSEEDQEENVTYSLKKYPEMYASLSEYIQQKLEKEEYITSYEALNKNNIKNVRIRNNVTHSNLLELNEILKKATTQLSQHRLILLNHRLLRTCLLYPELLLHYFEKNPNIEPILPKQFKTNPLYLNKILTILDKKIQFAIDKRNEYDIRIFSEMILKLIQFNPQFLDTLSETVKNNTIVKSILKNQIAFINNMSIEKMTHELETNETINFSRVLLLSQSINPNQFIRIIEQRQRCNLKPLPFCNDVNIIKEFIASLKQQKILWNDSENHYQKAKQQAHETYCFDLDNSDIDTKTALTFLAEKKAWLLAAISYSKFKQTAKFFELIKSLRVASHKR